MHIARKAAKWLGIGLASLFGLAFLLIALSPAIFSVTAYILKHKVDAEIAAIKAKGEPVTLADLAEPKVPDSQNGAVIYEQIFRAMDKPAVDRDFQVLSDTSFKKGWIADESICRRMGGIVARNQWMIPLLDQASSRPKCQFSLNLNDGPVGVKFPYLRMLRRLALLLRADAIMKANAGNASGAVRSLVLGYRLSDSLNDAPLLINQMVRSSVVAITSNGLKTVVEMRCLNEAQARMLYDTLAGLDFSHANECALKGERATGISFIELLRTHPRSAAGTDIDKPGRYQRLISSQPEKIGTFWRAMTYADELFYLRTMREWLSLVSVPYRDLTPEQIKELHDPELPRYALGSALVMPLSSHHMMVSRAGTGTSGSQILLALFAYRNKYGTYPADLVQLRAKLGWKIVEDPFSGKDFIYQRRGGGFVLYSIGPNLKDDGGKEPPKSDQDEGDIVWQVER